MLWTGGDEDSIGGGSTAPLGKSLNSIVNIYIRDSATVDVGS